MKTFKSKKHKRKVNYLVMFTTDAVDGKMSQMRFTPFWLRTLIFLICIGVGTIVGFFAYGESIYSSISSQLSKQKDIIATLEEEKEQLISERDNLNEKVAILSETLNQKVLQEKEEEELLIAMALPTEFPLTGSAQVEETNRGEIRRAELEAAGIHIRDFDANDNVDPEEAQSICLFIATDGTSAVASGNGTVIEVADDVDFGYRVVIDHGNGYKSVYLNKSEPVVREGDSISCGATIYMIKSENTTFGYQIMENDTYINAMDMIAISG